MDALSNTPYRIRTPRLVLRAMGPEDAQLRKTSVDASRDHLTGFFPGDPAAMTLEAHAGVIRLLRGKLDSGGDRVYGVFDPETGAHLGETGLMLRAGLRALELSYWLAGSATGRGIATEMAQAMVRIAFELFAVSRMDIHCDPENAASEKVARRLGFAFEGRLRDMQLEPHHERGDLLRFTLTASEYPQTAAAELPIEAFDFLDRPIVLPKTS